MTTNFKIITHNKKINSNSNSKIITHIKIQKKINTIHIIIHIKFPNLLKKKKTIKKLKKNLQKKINSINQKLVRLSECIKKPYKQPNILTKYITFQLKNKISFQKTIKKTIKLTKKTNIKKIKIKITNHLTKKKITHTKYIKKNKLPLQTIHTKINYYYYPIQTIYKILKIKI